MSIPVKVKWGKETVEVTVDLTGTVAQLREAVEAATGVPAARQKISTLKGQLKDDSDLRTLSLESKGLMLVGTAEAPPAKPAQVAVFTEDAKVGHADEAMSNGLVNLGNTCYLNSVLQLLRVVPELRARISTSENRICKALAGLFDNLDNTKDPVKPMLFWTTFMTAFPSFARTDDRGFPMQHDAQEALSSILEAAGEIAVDPGRGSLFRGAVSNGTEVESFTMMSCSITADVQILETGIERGLLDSSGVPRKISVLPQYLLVHMIRFAWRADTKENAKVLRPVAFPQVLDLQPFCTDDLKRELEPFRSLAMARRDAAMLRRKRDKQKSGVEEAAAEELGADLPAGPDGISGFYELASVVSHKGRTLDGGHYVAWSKKKGVWLLHDDDHVAPVTSEDINRLRGVGEAHIAYVLLYRCRDENGHAPFAT